MINYETKTDRELLLLVAYKSNETATHLAKINNRLDKHDVRLNQLESRCLPLSWREGLRNNWQTISLLVSVTALIALEIYRWLT